jgi:hypothetical protein
MLADIPHRKSQHHMLFERIYGRSYWIPGSYAPALSEKGNSFLRLLKNKGFREESMTKVGVDAIGTSTTLESNKSLVF